jgi:rRNA processing protein Krr1/Pno1
MSDELSKSAKRRAAKKARDAAHEDAAEEAAPLPPAPKAAAKTAAAPKATAAAPKAQAKEAAKPAEPKAEAKSKAKAKAEPAPAPKAKAEAKAEPKAKGKAEAKPKAKATPEPPAPEPAPAPKAASKKAAAKPKAKAEAVKEPPKKVEEEVDPFVVLDDGTGPEWETSSGLSKKAQKRKEKTEVPAAPASTKTVPGMGPADQHIPGMAPSAKSKAAAKNQSPEAILAEVSAKAAAARQAAEAEQKEKESNQSTATVKVPEAKIGIVIGPKGAKIKMIQEKTGAKIDASGEVFTIMGPPHAVSMAELAIRELSEKGYCSLQYEDFKEDFVNVHPSVFPDLIGKQGVIIRKMKEELGVEVSIPEVPKNAPASKKYKVGLAGANEKVETAKQVINDIVMYSHHEITHPGIVHVEMEVPQWCYSFLIGKAGSELRHIQNNYKVKVNIPRETSACQQVLVIGEKDNVDRAKIYIEKVLWNAENASKGRERNDGSAGDGWGDEEPEEDWMKAYMYKR